MDYDEHVKLRNKLEPSEEDRRWFEEHADELLATHGVGAYVAILGQRVLIATRSSAEVLNATYDAPRRPFVAHLGVTVPAAIHRGRGRGGGSIDPRRAPCEHRAAPSQERNRPCPMTMMT